MWGFHTICTCIKMCYFWPLSLISLYLISQPKKVKISNITPAFYSSATDLSTSLIFVSYRFGQVVFKLEEEEVSSCTQKVWAGAAIDFIQNQTNCKLLFLKLPAANHCIITLLFLTACRFVLFHNLLRSVSSSDLSKAVSDLNWSEAADPQILITQKM